jgi:hypothetical protein
MGSARTTAPRSDLAIDVFDASLIGLLPASADSTSVTLRGLVADGGSPTIREHLTAAARSGRHAIISTDGLRVGFFPVRFHRDVVGVLTTAAPDPGIAVPEPPSHAGDLDRRLDRLGWALRATLESDMVVWEKLDRSDQRARWAESLLRFIDYLDGCDDEAAVFTAVVQARPCGAISMRRSSRAPCSTNAPSTRRCPSAGATRRRDVRCGVHRHAARSPAPDVDCRTRAARLARRRERGDALPGLPWRASGGLVLAVVGTVDDRFDQVFRIDAHGRGTPRSFVGRRVRVLREDLVAHMQLPTPPSRPSQRSCSATSWARSRCRARACGCHPRRRGAADPGRGGPARGRGPAGALPDTEPLLQPGRLLLPLQVGLAAPGLLVLESGVGETFSLGDTAVAEAGATALEVWLAGAVRGLASATSGQGVTRASGEFERRIAEEIERARRFNLRTGLIVIDASDGEAQRRCLSQAPVVEAVRGQLRASDILGQLVDGRLAALLVHTDAQGVDAVATRMERKLTSLTGDAAIPLAVLGAAAFPSAGETAQHLLRAAEHDLARAASGGVRGSWASKRHRALESQRHEQLHPPSW